MPEWKGFDIKDPSSWVPANGNWGGPGWSAGERTTDNNKPPDRGVEAKGQVDAVSKTHDLKYFDARGKSNEAYLTLQADVDLLNDISKMDWSLLDAKEISYAIGMSAVFAAKIALWDTSMTNLEVIKNTANDIFNTIKDIFNTISNNFQFNFGTSSNYTDQFGNSVSFSTGANNTSALTFSAQVSDQERVTTTYNEQGDLTSMKQNIIGTDSWVSTIRDINGNYLTSSDNMNNLLNQGYTLDYDNDIPILSLNGNKEIFNGPYLDSYLDFLADPIGAFYEATTPANDNAPSIADLTGRIMLDGNAINKEDLANFDNNRDGKLTSADTKFNQLSIWQDMNEDGKKDTGELKDLTIAGIDTIKSEDYKYYTAGNGKDKTDWIQYSNRPFIYPPSANIDKKSPSTTNKISFGDIEDQPADPNGNNNFNFYSWAIPQTFTWNGKTGKFTTTRTNGEIAVGTNGDDNFGSASFEPYFDANKIQFLFGGGGNDSIFGGLTGNLIYGGTGDDIILGRGGNDKILGEDGNDRIYGEEGSDTLYGGAGADILSGGLESDTLYGDQGNDSLYGGDGYDYINAGSGDDIVSGGTGSDIIFGGTGIDRIDGSEDNDYIDGGMENDLIFGGAGNDIVFGGAGQDEIQGGDGNDNLFGEGDQDKIFGQLGDDVIYGGDGDDIVSGGTGGDTIFGGAGADEIDGNEDNDYIDGGMEKDLIFGGAGNDIVFGGAGQDEIQGGDGNDNLFGEGDQDKIFGELGDDVIYGGDGDDILIGFTGDNVAKQSLNPGETDNDTISGGVGNDIILGGVGNDSLFGQEGDDVISGGNGNDYLDGGIGVDALLGDTGNDTIFGGIGNDEIQGGSGQDYLYGETGNDKIFGQEGDDIIYGDDGDDILIGFTASNEWKQTLNPGETDNDTIYGEVGNDLIIAGLGNDVAFGGVGNDEIQGGSGQDYLYGETGNDKIFGQLGDDVIYGDDGDDILVGFTASNEWKQTLNPGETDNDKLYGGAGQDILLGGYGDDYIDGGAGADTMEGGAGSDTYIVNSVNDVVFERKGEGYDTVLSSSNYLLNAEIEELKLLGKENINGTGNSLDNLIVGNSGDNILDGVTGKDMLIGQGGNDVYYVDNINDKTTEIAGEGTDTVLSSISHTLQPNIENLNLLSYTTPEHGLVDGEKVLVYGYPKRYELDYMQGDAVPNYLGTCALTSISNLLTQAGVKDITEKEVVRYAIDNKLSTTTEQTNDPYKLGGSNYEQQMKILDGFGIKSGFIAGYSVEFIAERIKEGRGVLLAVNAGALWGNAAYTDKGQVNHLITVSGVVYDESNINIKGFYISDSGRQKVSDMVRYTSMADFNKAANVTNAYTIYTQNTIKLWDIDINGTGNELNNIIIGTEGNNMLDGKSGNDTLYGLGGNDTMYGDDGDDTISGGAGADTLYGGLGNDTYKFNRGDGQDVIIDLDGTDTIELGDGITKNDLEISIKGTTDSLTVEKYFDSDGGYKVEQLKFSDGTVWDSNGVNTLVRLNSTPILNKLISDTTANVDSTFSYTIPSDTFKDMDIIYGDKLTYTATLSDGSALPSWLIFDPATMTFSGMPTNNEVGSLSVKVTARDNAGASVSSNFNLTVYYSGSIVGTDSGEVLKGTFGSDKIYGLGGNDTMYGDNGDDTISGGAGNDTLDGGTGNDTYRFNKGDGQDVIIDSDGTDTIEFGEGITEDDVELTRSEGNYIRDFDLRISIKGTTDIITVRDHLMNQNHLTDDKLRIEKLKFSDGSVMNVEEKNIVINGTASGEWIEGTYFDNDIISGKAGGDLIYGMYGNDTYKFNRGDGQDVVIDWGGVDTIEFGEGIRKEDLEITRYVGKYGEDIKINIKGTTDSIIPNYWGYNYYDIYGRYIDYRIEQLKFSDGTTWAINGLNALTKLNSAPIVNKAITDKAINEDTAFTYTIPADTFKDIDVGDKLTYTVTLSNGMTLPSWLSFNPTTMTFSGTPTNDKVGSLNVKVTAKDNARTNVSSNFNLSVANVNDAPVVNVALADKSATEDSTFTYTIPSDTFKDIDVGDKLTYTATKGDGSDLPSWLSFNAATMTFSGTPTNNEVGSLNVKVTAKDTNGTSVSSNFNLSVANVNDAPVVNVAITDKTINEDTTFIYTIPADTFKDIDVRDKLTYTATLSDGTALPSWLTFDPGTITFRGTPANDDVGNLSVIVTATDNSGASINSIFNLSVNKLIDIYGTIGEDVLIGNRNDNNIYGMDGNDVIDGGLGLDVLNGGVGDDIYYVDNVGDMVMENINEGVDTVIVRGVDWQLGSGVEVEKLMAVGDIPITLIGNELDNEMYADSKKHTLIGGGGNDILHGGGEDGRGGDYLYGGVGDDIYYVNSGDVIEDMSGIDVIEFWSGVKKDDLEFVKSGDDLKIGIKGTTDGIIVNKWFLSDNYRIEKMKFSNGSVMNAEEKNIIINGTPIGEIVEGTPYDNDVIDGKGGNDGLAGYGGDDTYKFNKGYGYNVIIDSGGTDTIEFGEGITKDDLEFTSHLKDNLKISIKGTTDIIVLYDHLIYDYDNYKIERLKFSDGTVWGINGLNTLTRLNSTPIMNKIIDKRTINNDLDVTSKGSNNQLDWNGKQRGVFTASDGTGIDTSKINQLIQEMAIFGGDKGISWSNTIDQRPDDIKQILSLYWK